MGSKLYYRYSVMNSSKTANLIMVAHNYEEQGKKVLIFKPSLDTRSSVGKVESRVGISHDCIDIDKDFNIFKYIDNLPASEKDISCILLDECNFITKKQAKELATICDYCNIPVIAYGLKNSYIDGELFEGSSALLYYADKIEEIKNVCVFCNSKATQNLRVLNGKPIYDGEVINCGDTKEGEDYYIPVCRKHYFKPPLSTIKRGKI